MTPFAEAEAIIERMRHATAYYDRDTPRLLDLIMRRHPIERDALLMHTVAGQAALALNPAGQLIIRPKGNPALNRHLMETLEGVATWDGRQRGWRVQAEDAVATLSRILAQRRPIRERTNASHHPSFVSRPVPVVIHSAIGMAAGEHHGGRVTLRVQDARLRAAVRDGRPCGDHEEGRDMDRWSFAMEDVELARIWADKLR